MDEIMNSFQLYGVLALSGRVHFENLLLAIKQKRKNNHSHHLPKSDGNMDNR